MPVWREIHWSNILPATPWPGLINRTVSNISRRSGHSVCQSFFPAWIGNTIEIHSGETSRPRDFVASSVVARPHALKLASLTFKNFMRGQLLATLRYKSVHVERKTKLTCAEAPHCWDHLLPLLLSSENAQDRPGPKAESGGLSPQSGYKDSCPVYSYTVREPRKERPGNKTKRRRKKR